MIANLKSKKTVFVVIMLFPVLLAALYGKRANLWLKEQYLGKAELIGTLRWTDAIYINSFIKSVKDADKTIRRVKLSSANHDGMEVLTLFHLYDFRQTNGVWFCSHTSDIYY